MVTVQKDTDQLNACFERHLPDYHGQFSCTASTDLSYMKYLLIHDDMHMYCYSLLYILKTPELDLGTPKVITSKANYATPKAATSTKGTSTHNYHHDH